MTRSLSILMAFVALAGFSVGCGKTSPDEPSAPEDKTVSVASVSVSPVTLDLVAGDKATLTATVLPTDATDSSVSWSSADASVATVSQGGEVTAVAAGKTSITVTTKDGGKQAVCSVTVTPAHVSVKSVAIDPASLSVEKGLTGQLTVTVLPADASDPSVVWSSADESVATVSQDGLVMGLAVGNTVITVASKEDGTKKAECAVEVVKPSNVIWYHSYLNELVEPNAYGGIGRLVSNSFVDGWGEMVFEASISELGEKVFYNCSSLEEVILPAKVARIGFSAFSGCKQLSAISLPKGLLSLGDEAFSSCFSLKRMVLPSSLREIGTGAFSRCSQLEAFESSLASADARCLILDGVLVAFAPSGLTEYSIPAGTVALARAVMKHCTRLTAVTLPASVTSVGAYAFYNSSNLQRVTFLGTTPPVLGEGAFEGVSSSCRIYVPASAFAAYKLAEGWTPYINRIVPVE